MQKISKINLVYILELLLFTLIVLSVLPRAFAFALALLLVGYTIFTTLENSVVLFVRSIPFFIALPITSSFDSLNTWRIVAIVIFLKWLYVKRPWNYIASWRHSRIFWALGLLVVCACASLIMAHDRGASINRLIYFANLSMIGIVIVHLASEMPDFAKRIIKNLAVPVLLAAAVGFIQLALTYFIDIYQFIGFWGEGIQCRQFGNEWCYIATHVGNTWFAYFGDQRSLRVFSLFTDSHTFPIFLLLGMPSLFVLKSQSKRKYLWWLAIAATYLIEILSGTRGIWAASIGVVLGILILRIFFKRRLIPARSLFIFFAMFALAWPIFTSPQFLLAHGGLFRHRVKSIFDFTETSNKDRIAIWKASISSIQYHPVLGVGIGNFPIVLRERQELSKAGSSAHNLYLHVAAEMGLVALIALIWFFWQIICKLYANSEDIYMGSMLLYLSWILIYVLTDVALFDERAFLMISTVFALIISYKKPEPARTLKA